MKHISVIPLTSEKAYTSVLSDTYIFKVPLAASKQLIAENVEEQFSVTVVNITTLVQKGKPVRFARGKRVRPGETTRKDVKKAYVTLKTGDKIKVFDEEPIKKDEAKAKAADAKETKATVKAETKKAGLLTRRRTGRRGDK
ncbi:50S ribosomal protein L23 [Candidatus Saccharibacteria bacterium]|nr:50S ribosomal protein L23 [Candidatus Saccharibacteria bacterium]